MPHPTWPNGEPVLLGDHVEWDGWDDEPRKGQVSTIRVNDHVGVIWLHVHREDDTWYESNECFQVPAAEGYAALRFTERGVCP